MIYLDANATEILRPEARAAVLAALDLPGNPASIHAAGRAARTLLESARKSMAAALGGSAEALVFTSGGTEANALAIAAFAQGRRVIAGATEHDAVRAATAATGAASAVLPVDHAGQVALDALRARLDEGGPALVCLMLANNETGALHPIAEAARLCRETGALLHVDAVQAAGRIPVDLARLGAHSLAISGHKLGGGKGAGALLLAADAPALQPLQRGGGQERGRRGGTPALPAIAGMAAALEAAEAARESGEAERLAGLRDRLEAEAAGMGAILCGAAGPRLPNTACLALPGLRADLQVIRLDLAGIAISAGAACSSGKVARSHVLDAMGLTALAGCAIRVSLSWRTQPADIDAFLAAYAALASERKAA